MPSNLVKTSSEWNSSSLKTYIPPRGVLCVEISDEVSNDNQNINHNISIKVGDGERTYPTLPYLSFKDEYIEDIRIRLIKMINEQSDKIVDAYTKDEIDSLLKEIDDKINEIDTTVDLSEYAKKSDIPETHKHDNKSILDQIECVFTPQEKEKLANLNINDQGQTVNDHTHQNKSILDKIEVAMTKDDKEKLNQLTNGRNYDTEISQLKSDSHKHANIDILNDTTASFTTEYEEIIKNWKPSESATYESFKGSTDSDDGETGLVPAPSKGDQDKFLRGDGTWVTVEVSGSGESFTLVAGDNVAIVNDDENKTKTISVTIPSVDLSGYATTSYVDNKVSNIVIPTYDLSGYATQTWVTTQINNIDIPSLNGYAMEQYVDDAIDSIPAYTLPIATKSTLGGIIVGDNINVDEDGVISVDIPESHDYSGVLSVSESENDLEVIVTTKDGDTAIPIHASLPDVVGYVSGPGIYIQSIEYAKLTKLGYRRLDYIESDGQQYIDTGFVPSNNTTIIIDSIPHTAGHSITNNVTLFGTMVNNAYYSDEWMFWCYSGSESYRDLNNPGIYCRGSNNGITLTGVNLETRCIVTASTYHRNITIDYPDGTSITRTPTSYNSMSKPINTLYIFYSNTENVPVPLRMSYTRMYSCQILDNNECIMYLIPVKRISDNKVGMYDIRHEKFYASNTNVDFIAGNVISNDMILQSNTISVYDSGWISMSIDNENITSSDIEYRKIATGLVEVCGTFTPSASFNTLTLFTLPEEYHPHKKRTFIQLHPNILTPFLLTIDTDGVVEINSPSSIAFDDGQAYYIEAMFMI